MKRIVSAALCLSVLAFAGGAYAADPMMAAKPMAVSQADMKATEKCKAMDEAMRGQSAKCTRMAAKHPDLMMMHPAMMSSSMMTPDSAMAPSGAMAPEGAMKPNAMKPGG